MFGNWLKIDKKIFDRKISNYNKICKCPHCGKVPDTEKNKKFKCQYCKEYVFIKKVNNISYYLTENQNTDLINLKKFDVLKNKYFNTLVNNGYDQNKLEIHFEKLNIILIEDLKDFIWSSYNYLLSINVESPGVQSLIYFNMANFCASERNGNDVFTFQKLAFDMQLKSFEKDSAKGFIWEVVIVSSPKHPECYNDNGKRIPLNEIVKNPILPHFIKDSLLGCYCSYGLSASRDENNNLIFV